MLREHFYTLPNPVPKNDTVFRTVIVLNKDHDIFKGHFPELPVVPGVCMMAIVKELLEENTGKKLMLQSTLTMKFMALINPNEHTEVEVEIKYTVNDDGTITADGIIYAGNRPYFKITKAVYR
ncbi:MAG TPA: 3-hydroxyacyl-ACP dehydratase [Bacteroidia bacterium]|nr:3-hydroxyacyl-ACP dehydratase [Bacteroidia bacterium]